MKQVEEHKEHIKVLKVLLLSRTAQQSKSITKAINYAINQLKQLEQERDDLFSVSKRFEIDFDGNVLAGIEITNNEPKVFGAMNGWGNGISPDKCKITEKTH